MTLETTKEAATETAERQVGALRAEINEMAQIIHHAKAEIAAIKHPLADDDRILGASSELDAIVSATESATSDILDAAETLEKSVESLEGDELAAEILSEMTGQLTRIMEACGFQDLTGQRITKVVHALRHIEERVSAVLEIWEPADFADIPVEPRDQVAGEGEQLSGPQSDKARTSQADIDALFD